jgi:SHS2 domain-containing protein
MRRYRIIEHTADTGLVAYGGTLAEAYGHAAYGLFSIIADLRNVKEVESRTVKVKAKDPESLLFEWLNHLIYLFDVQRILFKRCEITSFDGKSLQATCHGEKYDPSHHRIKIGVKSATYHMLTVDPVKKRVKVIFDI